MDCFADDTGLEVDALNGEPGVYSARYAGEDHDAQNNMNKVLTLLANNTNRKACFRTVIALIQGEKTIYFEGKIDGNILYNQQGDSGFGYDPIFQPEESNLSFAQMTLHEKNKISHRGRAVQKLVEYINNI